MILEGIVGDDLMELICHIVNTFAVCATCRIRSIECTFGLIWYYRIAHHTLVLPPEF